jgi:hypothetical protein
MNAPKPKSSAFLTNLCIDMPVSKKLLFIFKNQWIKVKNFESCCHHPGEPAEAEGGPLVSGTYLLSPSNFDDKFVISNSSGGGPLARGG